MAYTHIRFGEMADALAARLADPEKVFWTGPELFVYLRESLRCWNSYGMIWRDRGVVTLQEEVPFYDLNQAMAPPITQPSVTDQDLVEDIQYALMEPVDGTQWTGSAQFTYQDLVQAIQRRRNQFLLETGVILVQQEFSGSVSPSTGRMILPDDTIDVRRAAWKDVSGAYRTLWRVDERELNSYLRGWLQNPGKPVYYSVAATPPLRFQIAPPPADSGAVNLISVNSGHDLDPANGPTILGIPDDFAWVVKFGALVDLLQISNPALDPSRAAYCTSRWKEGVSLAKISSSAMIAQIDGVPVEIHSIFDLDAWAASWQNSPAAIPRSIGLAGLNIVATGPLPDSSPHSLTIDTLCKFPLPASDLDFVQIGREHVDIVLDYAAHLASFKMGGAEFSSTTPLYESMVRLAADNNSRLRANAESFDILSNRSLKEGGDRPRRNSDGDLAPAKYEATS